MAIYNSIIENVVLLLGDILLRTRFISTLKKARSHDQQSEDTLAEFQMKKLGNILFHATQKSSYYKSLNIERNSDPLIWLTKFPILEKRDLYNFSDEILTCRKEGLIVQKSSGSSGVQSTVYWKKREWSEIQAFQTHWWEWADYRLGAPILQTGMTLKRGFVKKVKDILTRTIYLPAFAFEKDDAINAISACKKLNAHIGGYASSLYVLATIALDEKNETKFVSAITWGDKLFSHYKTTIEKAFGCKTYETYGTSEGFMIAAQKDLEFLYINTPQVFLEILDDEGLPVPDGILGNVVVTNLVNTAMPLIRYRIGDLAIKLPKEEYPEVREMAYPLLKKVIGRDTDIVKTAIGKSLVVHTFTGIFEHYPMIRQFKVVQETKGQIVIEYISEIENISPVLEEIRSEILQKTASENELAITFKKVSFIPPTKSGKPQIIELKIKTDQ